MTLAVWRIIGAVAAVALTGQSPALVPLEALARSTNRATDFTVTLDYVGAATTSPRGHHLDAGQAYRFGYSRFFAPIDWTVQFFAFRDVSARPFEDGIPRDRFGLSAEGTARLPAGEYVLQVISDEGVRIWMDGAMILDDWAPHESKVSRVPIAGGSHRFKVEYYDITGFAELRFDIQRK